MLWGAAAAALLLCAASAADREGFRRYLQLRREVERRSQRNTALAEQNAALLREISALRKDPRALERAAREELGFVKPGEVVLQLEVP
ncbi:MAG: septum formation initiator family protein [Myxococcaceae bacterium]|nr:septum formation initiator family protein [Myxococcaceae bacterium]